MLVGAQANNKTKIFIIKVDDIKQPGSASLIGGSVAAIVLPGQHDVTVQLHDQGRILIPLTLNNIKLEAGIGYLIDFNLEYPKNFQYIAANDHLKINIMITNLDTNTIIWHKLFNGWGKEI